MSNEAAIVFGILGVAAVVFASGRVRLDVTALLVVMALMLSGVLTPREALAGFGDPVVLLVAPIALSACHDGGDRGLGGLRNAGLDAGGDPGGRAGQLRFPRLREGGSPTHRTHLGDHATRHSNLLSVLDPTLVLDPVSAIRSHRTVRTSGSSSGTNFR